MVRDDNREYAFVAREMKNLGWLPAYEVLMGQGDARDRLSFWIARNPNTPKPFYVLDEVVELAEALNYAATMLAGDARKNEARAIAAGTSLWLGRCCEIGSTVTVESLPVDQIALRRWNLVEAAGVQGPAGLNLDRLGALVLAGSS